MAWPLGAVTIANNYGLQEEQPVIRTPMEQGPDRKTLRSTTYSTLVNVEILASAANLATFRAFYEGEAALGTGWFDMDIITTQAVATHSVRIESAQTTYLSNDLWSIRLQLETEEHIAS